MSGLLPPSRPQLPKGLYPSKQHHYPHTKYTSLGGLFHTESIAKENQEFCITSAMACLPVCPIGMEVYRSLFPSHRILSRFCLHRRCGLCTVMKKRTSVLLLMLEAGRIDMGSNPFGFLQYFIIIFHIQLAVR